MDLQRNIMPPSSTYTLALKMGAVISSKMLVSAYKFI
jgi:hypothetical protein